jgi:SAM-dependent methyltransferase
MTAEDGARWDATYSSLDVGLDEVAPPRVFASFERVFPTSGVALDLACGIGLASVWLARRGLDVVGVDVSGVAIARARDLAARAGLTDRCRFEIHDLDDGLPPGEPVDLVLCHLFNDPRLDPLIIERLAPGGLLAMACLSQIGGSAGTYRTHPGELLARFAALDVIVSGEADGRAWLLGRFGSRGTRPVPSEG